MGTEGSSTRWPALIFEERPWNPRSELRDYVSVQRYSRLTAPYRPAVVPPIAAASATLDPASGALVAEATDAVTRFDEFMGGLPVPMPSVLLRTESATSSQIENLTTSARHLAMAGLGLSDRRNAQLVAAIVRSMQTALAVEGPVDTALVLAVHQALLGESQAGIAGRLREEQVWIGGGGMSPHEALFVPPHHEHVPAAMEDLARFALRTDLPALAHAALLHAQFETIHPFADGNGRTGRVLLQALLRWRGTIRHTTVPLSAGLLADVDGYFAALTAYREGDIAPIVTEVGDAALRAVTNGRMLATEILELRADWVEQITARKNSIAWRLADALFAQPVVNADWVARTLGVSDRGARNAIEALTAAGILEEWSAARRNKVWQAPEVLHAMDDFAARAGRRSLPV